MKEIELRSILISQHTAALEMLRTVIQNMPDTLWDSPEYEIRTWRLIYHSLWGVGYYTGPSQDVQPNWDGAIEGAESLGGMWENPEDLVPVEDVHSPEELLGFLDTLLSLLPEAIAAYPLDAPLGFDWYPFTRLELQINCIRHTQHHTAQLIERMRGYGVSGLPWIATSSG